MNTQTLIFDTKTNVGTVDRYVRFAIGSGLIAVPLLYEGVDAEYAALTSLVAIPIIFTAIARWCPLYALLNVHSIRRKISNAEFYDQNVSVSDAIARYLLGTVLIIVTMLFTSIADPWLIAMALIAVPVIHSAIILWDPIYALFNVGTYKQTVAYNGGGTVVVPLYGKITDSKPTQPSGNTVKAA